MDNVDVRVDGEGTVIWFTPLSGRGNEWIDKRMYVEEWQYNGNSIAVEPRMASDIVVAMRNDGLRVSTANFYVQEVA